VWRNNGENNLWAGDIGWTWSFLLQHLGSENGWLGINGSMPDIKEAMG